jgi:long-chain acyl-CoA synthetase
MGEKHLGALGERAAARGGTLHFEGQTFDSAELYARATRLAGGLAAAGVGPGDRVVVMMANCPEVGMAYNALWRIGAAPTPVIFLVTAPELEHILTDSGAVAVLTTPEFAPKVAETGVPVATYVVGEPSFDALEAAEPAALVEREDDDLAALLYTGGTTGRSKGVMLSHANLWGSGQAATTRAEESAETYTRSITALPLAHAYGLLVTVVGMFAAEPGEAVLQRWFNPATFLALAAEHQTQLMSVVPSMLQLLLAQGVDQHDLSALRVVTSGGAPLPEAVRAEWEKRLPDAIVLEGYGLTETSALVSSSSREARRPGSVGRAVPGTEVRITGEDGQSLPAGTDGEICVRSSMVTKGYWRAEAQTAAAIEDGWLHTGDVGHLDADGYLFVVDRIKDLIIRGGFNVYPRDIEDALIDHPEITAAAVVGRPDARSGEEVVAFVSLAAGSTLTEDEVREFAKTRISGAKYPREVHIVDAIPLTSVGKTDRKALRSRVVAPA